MKHSQARYFIHPFAQSHKRLLHAALFVFLFLWVATLANAQPHTMVVGNYVLRASAANSQNLAAETARQHGIERNPNTAVLNITVGIKNADGEKTIPSGIAAYARNLSGHRREIPMREVATQGYVSYVGAFDFVHGEVLDFEIHATPHSSKKTIHLKFRDRLWARGDLPDRQ